MLEPMGEVIDETVDKLFKDLETNPTGEVNMKPWFQDMALKILATCAMSISIDENAREVDRSLLMHGRDAAATFQVSI